MKITKIRYLKLISFLCISLVCKIDLTQATELFDPKELSPLIGFGQENFTFEITDFGVKGKTVKFEPNIAGVVRLGLNAYGFGIGYSLRGSSKDTDPQKGTTSFSDWQLGYNSKHWGVDGYYQTYDGFFTSNTNAVQTYPNLGFKHFGITGRYALGGEEFSVGALMDQSEEIKSTSGKYYLVGGIHQHEMLTNVPLLQQEYAGVNPEMENLRSLKAVSISAGAGAGKYWLFTNRLFTGALLDLMATYANYDLGSTTGKLSTSDVTLSFDLKLAFGYVGTSYRSGLAFTADTTRLKAADGGYLNSSANRFLAYIRMVF